MSRYVILIRGINVGGKNKVSMSQLKLLFEEQGFKGVLTYIQSGNVILNSKLTVNTITDKTEKILHSNFNLDSRVKVLVIEAGKYKKVVDLAPKEFGKDDSLYRYYVLFLMGVKSEEAMREIAVRDGVDKAWRGDLVIYYQLPSIKSPNATKSYLNKVMGKPMYKALTIRNWNTTKKLLKLIELA